MNISYDGNTKKFLKALNGDMALLLDATKSGMRLGMELFSARVQKEQLSKHSSDPKGVVTRGLHTNTGQLKRSIRIEESGR